MWRPDTGYPQVVLGGLVTAVVLAIVVGASTSAVAFGAFNPSWDGANGLQAQADAVGADPIILRDTARYDELNASGTVAVVLSPDRPYSPSETESLRAFVERGGTLVVAEDFGRNTNPLFAGLGVEARVDGRLLRDERNTYRSPAMPVARPVSGGENASEGALTGVDSLALNYGTVVDASGENVEVLFRSSEYSYLDANGSGTLDPAETLGARPVVTAERIGAGRVVVVSDPSALINAMLDRPDNQAFVRALFDGAETVALDYTHTAELPPLALATLVVRESAPLQILATVVLVGGVALWTRWPTLRDTSTVSALRKRVTPGTGVDPRLDATSAAAFIERQHPDWDQDRIERVVHAQLHRTSDGTGTVGLDRPAGSRAGEEERDERDGTDGRESVVDADSE